MMADTIEQLKNLLPGIEFGRGTHVDWAEWFEKNPTDPRIKALGDTDFHRNREAEYDARILAINSAITEIERLREAGRDMLRHLEQNDPPDMGDLNGWSYLFGPPPSPIEQSDGGADD